MEKKLSNKVLRESWLRWEMGYLSDMSYQWEMTFAFVDSMLPIIKELYPNDQEELQKGMERHNVFYCTEPQLGSIISGIVCGLEEERANGAEIDDETINSVKVGLMGPLAGIGDSMIPGMYIPLLLSIGIGLANGGSVLGPIFYILTYVISIGFGSYFIFKKGYQLGTKSVDILIGDTAQKVREAINLLGAIVVGGVGASYVNLNLAFKIGEMEGSEGIVANDMINGIFPKLLPLLVVLFAWWLMAKKNVSAIKMLIAFFIIALIGVGIGIF